MGHEKSVGERRQGSFRKIRLQSKAFNVRSLYSAFPGFCSH